VAKLQAASGPIAKAAVPWDRQTDGETGGRIALFRNAALGRGPKTSLSSAIYYADNVALPAFARRCCGNRSISPACRAHSSKPAVEDLLPWTDKRTDGEKDGQTAGRRTVS